MAESKIEVSQLKMYDNGWASRIYLTTNQLNTVETKYAENSIITATKTLYYLNAMTPTASSNIHFLNTEGIMVLRARCSYL